MPSLNPPLTKDDFINSPGQDAMNSSERKDCLTYDSTFWKKALTAAEAGNMREQILIHQQRVEQSDPWVKFASIFKDDPLFDEFVEDMAAYRRELDTDHVTLFQHNNSKIRHLRKRCRDVALLRLYKGCG